MKYKFLGRTGVQVSELCFGTMSFGGDADAAESAKMYQACRNKGLNFFDCADVYNGGKAEEILGGLMKGHRDELIITSKSYNKVGKDINSRGNNRRHIVKAVEDSLKRLGTDRIDVHFMHAWDDDTPLEETLRAQELLVESGKVLYLGASNYAAWQIATALGISKQHGWARIDVIQPMYSLVKRQVEIELLPLAEAEGLGVMTYSPVGGGLLSGKYGPGKRAEDGRLSTNPMYTNRYRDEWVFEAAGAFTELSQGKGVHPVSMAVAWVGAHPQVSSPIIGARNVNQLGPSLASVDIDMTPELRAEIAALSPTPAPATDRSEEQAG